MRFLGLRYWRSIISNTMEPDMVIVLDPFPLDDLSFFKTVEDFPI
jgi:hypothetical protein